MLKQGVLCEEALMDIAPVLSLDPSTLLERALNEWRPQEHTLLGMQPFTSSYKTMFVNAYLIWDPISRQAALFDTGTSTEPILKHLKDLGLTLNALFITHSHTDHIAKVEEFRAYFPQLDLFINALEPFNQTAHFFESGAQFSIGALTVETRLTCGHSVGGTTYFIQGLECPVAIVGDALFAQSLGGGIVSYAQALGTTRQEILSLPDHTIICPGHGPLTSVNEEKSHNPFFKI